MPAPNKSSKKTVDVFCAQCGKAKIIYLSAAHHERHFCSRACQGKWRSINLSGSKSQNWKGNKKTVCCSSCKKFLLIELWRFNRGSKDFFCNIKCFANWKAIHMVGSASYRWRGGNIKINCNHCNTVIERNPDKINKYELHFCNHECYGKWKSINRVGSNHPSWKGGVTPENNRIRATPEYKEWRFMVFGRDNYTCQICFSRGLYLHAHHIRKFADYPMLRLAVFNGITLCRECHKEVFTHEEKYIEYFENLLKEKELIT